MRDRIGVMWLATGFGVAVMALAGVGGCRSQHDEAVGLLVGNWVEDVPVVLNQPEPDRAAMTLTGDGWVRMGLYLGKEGKVDPKTVTEERFTMTKPASGPEYAVVGGAAMARDGERLVVQGPGQTVYFRRTEAVVPSTRPIFGR